MIRGGLVVLLAATTLSADQAVLNRAYPASLHGGPYMFNYYLPPAPSSTPWAPCWSADGKWIAVAMQGSIWRVDPLDGSARELTRTGGYASSPAISPDGKWLVYSVDDHGKRIQELE